MGTTGNGIVGKLFKLVLFAGGGGSMKGDDGGVSTVYENPKLSGEIERSSEDSVLGVPGVRSGVFRPDDPAERAMNRPLARGCVCQLSLKGNVYCARCARRTND